MSNTRRVVIPAATWVQINSTFRSGFITTSDQHGMRIAEFEGIPPSLANGHLLPQGVGLNYDITAEGAGVGIWATPVIDAGLVTVTP